MVYVYVCVCVCVCVCVYSGILFSHKKEKILPFVTKWMEFGALMLSEISQVEKGKYCMISYVIFKKQKAHRNRIGLWLPELEDGGNREMLVKG